MNVKCERCEREGTLGQNIFRQRVYTAPGKKINVLLCNRCEQKIKVVRRPVIN